jgi:hypothetical protein
MFTQLSLFDSVGSVDPLPSAAGFVHVAAKRAVAKRATSEPTARREPARREPARREPARCEALERPVVGREVAYERRIDELQPMGDLARLVLARYDLLASRRRERDRRRREQPRQSIRVLSPPATLS